MTELKAPEPCRVESHLTLQLLVDRAFKKMLKNKADAVEQLENTTCDVAPLTVREVCHSIHGRICGCKASEAV